MEELQKAKIVNLEAEDKQNNTIPCLFNPSEYSLKEGIKYAKKNDYGRDGADFQYIHGDGTELTLSLYFDTTGALEHGENQLVKEAEQTAVTEYTKKIVNLMRIQGDLHRPPKIQFSWGNLIFDGILTSLNQNFTYFGIDGRPLRAKLDLVISSVQGEGDVMRSPFESPDRTKYRTMIQGSTLWKLAYEEYGSCERWREIAEANEIMNPLVVTAGQVLKLPPLTGKG